MIITFDVIKGNWISPKKLKLNTGILPLFLVGTVKSHELIRTKSRFKPFSISAASFKIFLKKSGSYFFTFYFYLFQTTVRNIGVGFSLSKKGVFACDAGLPTTSPPPSIDPHPPPSIYLSM